MDEDEIGVSENTPLLEPSPGTSPKNLKSYKKSDYDANKEMIIEMTASSKKGNEEGSSRSHYKNKEEMLHDSLPNEIIKTISVGFFLAVCFYLNTLSLVLTHQRLPDRNSTKALPDIILDNIPLYDDGLYIAEIFIMFSVASTIITITFHRFRWIVFRRIFFILSLLYLYRSITMYVTVFPEASYTYYCSPKLAQLDLVNVLLATLKVVSGFGLSINGEHVYCGDYMFSGHAVILLTAALFLQEYLPRGRIWWKILAYLYWVLSIVGIILVLFARGHYTIDVLVAYFITTRLFWMYHNLVHHHVPRSSETYFINRVWWYKYFIFEWVEGNIPIRIPSHFSVPFSSKFYADFESTPIRIKKLPQNYR